MQDRMTEGCRRMEASIFCALVAVLIAGIYYICRSGFPHYGVLPLIKTVFLAFFILFLPHVGRLVGFDTRSYWFSTDAAVCFWGVLFISVAGLAAPHISLDLGLVFCALGGLLCASTVVAWARSTQRSKVFRFCGAACLGALLLALSSFYLGYQTPLIDEQVIVGLAHRDTLNHASVTSMIRTYGIPSTGLDGIPYHPYHNGSDWILAQVSALLNLPVLETVTMGYLVLFSPLFLNSLFTFVLDLRRRFSEQDQDSRLELDAKFWTVVAILFIGIMPGQNGFIASQSYGPGLVFSFIFLSLCLCLFDRFGGDGHTPATAEKVLILVFLPCLAAVIGFCKVSQLWLLGWASAYFFVRLRLYRSGYLCAGFLVMSALSLCTLKFTLYPADAQVQISPFYIRTWLSSSWPFSQFAWSWLFVMTAVYSRWVASPGTIRHALRDKSLLDVEAVLVVTLCGAAPALLLAISDASGAYFMDFQRWLSGALLLASLPEIFRDFSLVGAFRIGNIRPKHIVAGTVATIFVVMAVVSFATIASRTFIAGQVRTRVALRSDAATALEFTMSLGNLPLSEVGRGLLLAARELSAPIDESQWSAANRTNRRTLDALEKIAELPLSEKRETLLYIPKTNRLYWDLPASVCLARPFIAPAVTGIAMIDGLPGPECHAAGGRYGYEIYTPKHQSRGPADTDLGTLCSTSLEMGFSNVLILEAMSGGVSSFRQLPCPGSLPKIIPMSTSPWAPNAVIPVKTGIQGFWIPASAGMTDKKPTGRCGSVIFMFSCDFKGKGPSA